MPTRANHHVTAAEQEIPRRDHARRIDEATSRRELIALQDEANALGRTTLALRAARRLRRDHGLEGP